MKNTLPTIYDLIIVGAGPAGLTASIYASRYDIKHLVLGSVLGGAALDAHQIENWPGEKSIAGQELMAKFQDHAQSLGANIKTEEVISLQSNKNNNFVIKTHQHQYQAKSLILALGTKRQRLNVPGEAELLGKGVSYCATCDGYFFKNKTLAVVGGSNAAVMNAQMLSSLAKKVYIIYRRDQMRAEPIWLKRVLQNPKIEVIYNAQVKKINGTDKIASITLDKSEKAEKEMCHLVCQKGTHQEKAGDLKVDGLFIEIGSVSMAQLAINLGVKLDPQNYIIVNAKMETSLPGILAAGDCTTGSGGLRQITTAVAEGTLAALNAYNYLNKITR